MRGMCIIQLVLSQRWCDGIGSTRCSKLGSNKWASALNPWTVDLTIVLARASMEKRLLHMDPQRACHMSMMQRLQQSDCSNSSTKKYYCL